MVVPFRHVILFFAAGFAGTVVALACDGGPDRVGSATGGGGTDAGAGGSSNGADGGASDAAASFACIAARAEHDPDPGGTDPVGADCCATLGTCTAEADLTADPYADAYGLSSCDPAAALRCAPKPDAEQPMNGVTPPCTLTLGAVPFEGRCIPRCFVIDTPGAGNLDAGDCDTTVVDTDVVCAPCYSPLDGAETGACTRTPGDAPAQLAPSPFVQCGRYPVDDLSAPLMGYCIATGVVVASGQAAEAIAQLPRDTCAASELCVPKSKVEHLDDCFDICASELVDQAVCVPTYILEAPGSAGEGVSEILDPGQKICGPGYTCTPCISPIDGTVTGACAN